MYVTITLADVATLESFGSVARIQGIDEDARTVIVSGEPRMLLAIAEALVTDGEDEVVVDVESWQLYYSHI